MINFANQEIASELKKLIGDNLEPTQDLERMLMIAYEKGRTDAFSELGIDESELPGGDEFVAWTA